MDNDPLLTINIKKVNTFDTDDGDDSSEIIEEQLYEKLSKKLKIDKTNQITNFYLAK